MLKRMSISRSPAEGGSNQTRGEWPMGQPAERLTEALAAHLPEVVRNAADAGEEEGQPGQVQRKQFEHGRMHDTSGIRAS